MRIRMKVVSEDATLGQIIDQSRLADPAVMHGTGPHSFVCGGCGVVLVDGVRFGQLESVSIRCAPCGALNAIPQVMGGDSGDGR